MEAAWLDLIIYHIGSGNAFFQGVAMILLGILLSPWTSRRWLALLRNLLVLLGGIMVAISAIPLPWWLYALLFVLTANWLVLEWVPPTWFSAKTVHCRVGVSFVWLAALGMELPYHITPTLPPLGNPTFFLIGDSVSAGMSENKKGTWPLLLAEQHAIEMRDYSKMGAVVRSARAQANKIGDATGLVLLEIGGNDLLGSTTPDAFEEQLELLLAEVCRFDRTVVMLELPLTPFANRFGLSQRQLAAKYSVSVILIPRRIFVGVLTTSGATLDRIHLSPSGHALMAQVIWELVRPAYARES